MNSTMKPFVKTNVVSSSARLTIAWKKWDGRIRDP